MHILLTIYYAMADAIDKMLGDDEPHLTLYDEEGEVPGEPSTPSPPSTPKSPLGKKEAKAAKSLQLLTPNGNSHDGDSSSSVDKPPAAKKAKKVTTWAALLKEMLPPSTIARFKAHVPLTYTVNKKQEKAGIQHLDMATHDSVRMVVLLWTRVLLKEALKEADSDKILVQHINAACAPKKHDCYGYVEPEKLVDADGNPAVDDPVINIIAPNYWGTIVQRTLALLKKGTSIDVQAAVFLLNCVELETVHVLRDAAERCFENGKNALNSKNIEGALKTYSRYRDEDVGTELEEVKQLVTTAVN